MSIEDQIVKEAPSTREQWIANGFAPCQANGCAKLISPSLLPAGYCVSCYRKVREQRKQPGKRGKR